MRKKLLIPVITVIIGTTTGLGIYYWLNPLGGANENLGAGTILLKGTFVEFDSSHYGSGTTQIVLLSNGNRQLQFIDVEIANGPDLYVYLSDKSTFSSIYENPGNYVDLGRLHFNTGNFSINIAETTSLNNIMSVLIWCKQFSVSFTYAILN
ncbi:MAG: DM13 domain-containing protein [Candidatus Thorarchaeota archaeon]